MSKLILPYKGVLPKISKDAFIAPTATVIGDVEIGAGASLWFGVVARGDVNYIRIGENSNIQDGTIIHVASDRAGRLGALATLIGCNVTVGHGAILHACKLEDGCFVGMGATVMDGAVVEANAMVAAGALVTPGKRVKAGELWDGVPARMMRVMSEEEIDRNADAAPHYAQLAREYLKAK